MSGELTNKILFNRLKKLVEFTFLQKNSASNPDISQWKGQDIVNFQEDLRLKVNGRVSEKWFYTHVKSDIEKLPRIDMLNLLSNYCGFKNWADFVEQNEAKEEVLMPTVVENVNEVQNIKELKRNKKINLTRLLIPITLFIIVLIAALLYFFQSRYFDILIKGPVYEFNFINADSNKSIRDLIEITIRRNGLPPHYKNTTNGYYSFHSKWDTVQMIVNSNYYKKDTFDLILSRYNGSQTIELQPDDYKLVLRYYLQSDNLEVRREKMMNSIHPNAQIYRVYDDNETFIEPYSVERYVNFLSVEPAEDSLKNLEENKTYLENFEIVHSKKKDNKFIYIKFKISEPDAP